MSIDDATIDEKIKALPPEERERFDKELRDKMWDHMWLEEHGLSDVHPDKLKARRIFYREEYIPEVGDKKEYGKMFERAADNITS